MVLSKNINVAKLKLEAQKYLDEHLIDEDREDILFAPRYCGAIVSNNCMLEERIGVCKIEEDLEPTFSQTLFQFIKEKDISEVDCYKNSNIDRRLFSKIRSDSNYQPRKNTVFALCIGLRLNLKEAKKLLYCAGYSISHSLKCDTVMEYLIKKGVYDILLVNELLFSFECPMLGIN